MKSDYDEGNRLLSMGDSDSNETGQYYYRARMYSPMQGRFISNDPMGMVDGANMYMYVRNDPVNARDPTGRYWYFDGPWAGTDDWLMDRGESAARSAHSICVSRHGHPEEVDKKYLVLGLDVYFIVWVYTETYVNREFNKCLREQFRRNFVPLPAPYRYYLDYWYSPGASGTPGMFHMWGLLHMI